MTNKEAKLNKVHIIDNYYFTVDNLFNHTLYHMEKREKQKLGWKAGGTGEIKEFIETIGYYPNMKILLKSLAIDSTRRKIANSTITSINEYLDYYNQITERLEHIKL